MTEATKAISSILDALETYKERHDFRYGSIESSLVNALIGINKLDKENEKHKKSLNLVVEDRDSQVKMYVNQNKILQNELEKATSETDKKGK